MNWKIVRRIAFALGLITTAGACTKDDHDSTPTTDSAGPGATETPSPGKVPSSDASTTTQPAPGSPAEKAVITADPTIPYNQLIVDRATDISECNSVGVRIAAGYYDDDLTLVGGSNVYFDIRVRVSPDSRPIRFNPDVVVLEVFASGPEVVPGSVVEISTTTESPLGGIVPLEVQPADPSRPKAVTASQYLISGTVGGSALVLRIPTDKGRVEARTKLVTAVMVGDQGVVKEGYGVDFRYVDGNNGLQDASHFWEDGELLCPAEPIALPPAAAPGTALRLPALVD